MYRPKPRPDWWRYYRSLTVEDRWAYISTYLDPSQAGPAESMCHDIAAITYDENAEPIGVTDVLIFSSSNKDIIDCDVPEGL